MLLLTTRDQGTKTIHSRMTDKQGTKTYYSNIPIFTYCRAMALNQG